MSKKANPVGGRYSTRTLAGQGRVTRTHFAVVLKTEGASHWPEGFANTRLIKVAPEMEKLLRHWLAHDSLTVPEETRALLAKIDGNN